MLTLIGTVHHDPRSAAFLAGLLARLRPDRLTVELSPEAVAYRRTRGVLLLRRLGMIVERLGSPHHSGIADIRSLLALPYEYSVAEAYAREQGLELHAIDDAVISLRKLRQVEESLISLHHIRKILATPEIVPAESGNSLVLARQLLSTPDERSREAFLRACRGSEGIGSRDHYQAAKIRTLLAEHSGHLVHIGGWVHLIDDPRRETLFSLLADLQPQRFLLDPDHSESP